MREGEVLEGEGKEGRQGRHSAGQEGGEVKGWEAKKVGVVAGKCACKNAGSGLSVGSVMPMPV